MDFGTAARRSGALRTGTDIRSNDYFAFQGGLNLMDSPMEVPPGSLLGALNIEPGVTGGYRRINGYEPVDGHPSPTDTDYAAIEVSSSFLPAAGTSISESTSGATGVVAYVDTTNHYVVITNISGTFTGSGTTLTAGAFTSTSLSSAYLNGAPTDTLANEYYLQKFTYLMSAIGPVGGSSSSGDVLGVIAHDTQVFAIRNNSGGTAADLWKATSSGWTKVDLGIKVYYDTGVYSSNMQPPPEGTVLTGQTSGATMTIKRIVLQTGTWGSDAAGYFIVSSITGTPTAGETFNDGSGAVLNYLSHAAQTLPAGGTYEFRSHNFRASEDPTTGYRLYAVNGVGNGFEYDHVSDTFVLIETGMGALDKPTHLGIQGDYLFFGFAGGSLQNSGYQLPLVWNVVFGADSRSVGKDITFIKEDTNETMIIGTRKDIWQLAGNQVENFQLKRYATEVGAIARTTAIPGHMVFMEDRGFTTVEAAAQYGNFESRSLSNKILDIVRSLITTDEPVGAVVIRKRNLYRIMFKSGTMLCLSVDAGGRFTGWTECFVLHPPRCFSCSFFYDGTRNVERALFGSSNGYVYELDKGRSFAGQNVRWFARMSYWHSRTPDYFKRYRRIQVDVAPEGQATVSMSVDFDYGNRTGQTNQALDFYGNGGYWDVSAWDQFTWDAPKYSQALMKVEGSGYNIGLFFAGDTNNDAPITLYGASLQWSRRVINRNTGVS